MHSCGDTIFFGATFLKQKMRFLTSVVIAIASTLLASLYSALLQLANSGNHRRSILVSVQLPYSITISSGTKAVFDSKILNGSTNSTVSLVEGLNAGHIINGGGQITITIIEPNVVKISINASSSFVGARFSASSIANLYGVWEYPWFGRITDANAPFDIKGLGDSDCLKRSNARAPFFFADSGHGVYANILGMGSFDFKTSLICPTRSRVVFGPA